MNPFFRKTIFLWQVPAIAGGKPGEVADRLSNAGFEGVIVKVADGPYAYKSNVVGWTENLSLALVDALHGRGIAVMGYGFLYGANPTGEADIAIVQTHRYGLDGYVFDVEGQFDSRSNAEANAYAVMARYRKSCPTTPTAFCSWALWKSPRSGATWHPVAVAKAFMQSCDVAMPMVYWGGETPAEALAWLKPCLAQWQQITDKPIIPAGRAYIGDGGKARPDAVRAFAQTVREAGLKGISWWSMQHAMAIPEVWAELAASPGFASPADPTPEQTNLPYWALAIDEWARRYGYTGPAPRGIA